MASLALQPGRPVLASRLRQPGRPVHHLKSQVGACAARPGCHGPASGPGSAAAPRRRPREPASEAARRWAGLPQSTKPPGCQCTAAARGSVTLACATRNRAARKLTHDRDRRECGTGTQRSSESHYPIPPGPMPGAGGPGLIKFINLQPEVERA